MAFNGVVGSIPLGQYGLYTDISPDSIPPNALIYANNITLEKGLIQKAPGTLIYNTNDQLDSSISAVHDWWPDTVKQRMIALTDTGNIYRDIGDRTFTSATAINTGLGTPTPRSMFVEGGREIALASKKLFLFTDGMNQVQVLEADGLTFSTIDAPAADWTTPNFPRAGVPHRNRLWAFMGQRAYASDTANHENFTSNNLTQAVFPGEGGDIIGAHVFKGRLFCYKDDGFVYYLDDSASDSSTWFWRRLSANFGLASPNGLSEVLNDMVAVNDSGTITSYAAVEALGDIESGDILSNAQMERFLRASTSTSGIKMSHLQYYEEKKLLFMTYRTTYQTANDMLLVLDLNVRNQPRVVFWQKGTPQCLAKRKDITGVRKPIYGDASGYIHMMDYEDRLEGTTAYTGSFQTAYTDFSYMDPSLAHRQKHFKHIWLSFVEEGSHSVLIDVFIDGKFMETITYPMQNTGVHLDTFLLDTDRLAENTTNTGPYRLHGTGNKISFKIYNSGSNESFQIAGIHVGFKPGPDAAQRF